MVRRCQPCPQAASASERDPQISYQPHDLTPRPHPDDEGAIQKTDLQRVNRTGKEAGDKTGEKHGRQIGKGRGDGGTGTHHGLCRD